MSKLRYGALLHLGSNMWGDFEKDPLQYAHSAEEEAKLPKPLNASGNPEKYHSYLECRDELWTEAVNRAAQLGLDHIFIDLGEGIEYPSHPELKVPGTWSVEKIRKELARMRALGVEPLPKLNFSTCHDSWLQWYHRMVSTPKYYQVVADVIKDVCEIFDQPKIFHLGFDEEVPVAGKSDFCMVIRQGELWWHDLEYTIAQVEKNGSRAAIWADAICAGRETFLKRMSKGVLMCPWYYYDDFSEKNLTWNAACEKKVGTWDVQRNLAASFVELDRAGYDLYACTSNWGKDEASSAMVKFCREKLNPDHLKGIFTAPWQRTIPRCQKKTLQGLELFAQAIQEG